MIEFLYYIILGIIQGIFEWLPISSQGSILIYLSNILNIPFDISLNYSIFLHFGTLFAAIIYFRKDIYNILCVKNLKFLINKNFKILYLKPNNNKNLFLLRFLFISVIITFIISAPIYFFMLKSISNINNILLVNLIIGILLIFTGLIIYISKKSFFKKPNLSIKNSFLLGIFQGFAIIPGLSRSGLTTSLLLFRGFSPEKAFKISFLLSIPTIFIGEIVLLIINGFFFSPLILISLLFSFIFGYLTIDLLIKFAKKINFSYFCFILGVLYILTFFM